MKKFSFALFLIFAVSQMEALLPPLYQTAAEIKAIMGDDQLGEKLQSGEIIQKIEKIEQGYEITTNKSQVQVKVIYEPQQYPGPARWKILFETATPLDHL